MKKITITYWIVTASFATLMTLSAIPDITRDTGAVEFFKHLGYPAYLLPFLGVAKLLGVAAVLFPRFPRLKEWAYAGLAFDLIGAFYSHLSVGDPVNIWIFSVIGLVLCFSSYFLYHKKTGVSHNV